MQLNKVETPRHAVTKRANGRHPVVLGHTAARDSGALGFQRALQALATAYGRVAAILDEKIEHADTSLAQLAALGTNYAWISDRRRLVKTFLESEPAILAYAHCDCRSPDQIRSLAETATELAGNSEKLSSALGLLNYIDIELGWAAGEGRLALG
jgi:hypothetical protein